MRYILPILSIVSAFAGVILCFQVAIADISLPPESEFHRAVFSSSFFTAIIVNIVVGFNVGIDLVSTLSAVVSMKKDGLKSMKIDFLHQEAILKAILVAGLISSDFSVIFFVIPRNRPVFVITFLGIKDIVLTTFMTISLDSCIKSKNIPIRFYFNPHVFNSVVSIGTGIAFSRAASGGHIRVIELIIFVTVEVIAHFWMIMSGLDLATSFWKTLGRNCSSSSNNPKLSGEEKVFLGLVYAYLGFKISVFVIAASHDDHPWANVSVIELCSYSYIATIAMHYLVNMPLLIMKSDVLNMQHSLEAKKDLMKGLSLDVQRPRELLSRAQWHSQLVQVDDGNSALAVQEIQSALNACSLFLVTMLNFNPLSLSFINSCVHTFYMCCGKSQEDLGMYGMAESGSFAFNFVEISSRSFLEEMLADITLKVKLTIDFGLKI